MLTHKIRPTGPLLRTFIPLITDIRTEKSRPQFKAELDSNYLEKLQNGELPARKHPGANLQRVVSFPKQLVKAIERIIGDHPHKKLTADGKLLEQYLKARHVPAEDSELKMHASDIRTEVETKLNVDVEQLDEEQLERYEKLVQKLTEKTLKDRTFAWKPLDYDDYRSLMYLFARGVQDYGAITNVLKEITIRDPEFKPKSFFDFGSGVGTGTLAVADLWKDQIYEYYCVDSSEAMNNVAELLLKGGEDNKERSLRNVYYRQFLGAPTTSYDIVLSAFSLIELPNRKTRLEVLANLWTRCSGYLILIELGTNTGFKLINEARSFLNNIKDVDGHLFAPCPHEIPCPRIKMQDGTPCNFESRYFPLKFSTHDGKVFKDRFSYVVFRKGSRVDAQWPRLVRETLVRSRHAFCRLCTTQGNLREIVVTQGKHGKEVYRTAKNSCWGDRLPIAIEDIEEVTKVE